MDETEAGGVKVAHSSKHSRAAEVEVGVGAPEAGEEKEGAKRIAATRGKAKGRTVTREAGGTMREEGGR